MIELIGFALFFLYGLFLDYRAENFKDSIAAIVILVPSAVGLVEALIIQAVKYFFF